MHSHGCQCASYCTFPSSLLPLRLSPASGRIPFRERCESLACVFGNRHRLADHPTSLPSSISLLYLGRTLEIQGWTPRLQSGNLGKHMISDRRVCEPFCCFCRPTSFFSHSVLDGQAIYANQPSDLITFANRTTRDSSSVFLAYCIRVHHQAPRHSCLFQVLRSWPQSSCRLNLRLSAQRCGSVRV